MQKINQFVKTKRKNVKLTQEELAQKSGVGLRFVHKNDFTFGSLFLRKFFLKLITLKINLYIWEYNS